MKTEIKANDLRVDNVILVSYKDKNEYKEQFVTASMIMDIQSNFPKGISSFYYKPLEITEELLLKCDNITPESKLNLSFIINDHTGLWVDKSNENNPVWHFVWNGKYKEVKYFHKLQNLIYELEDIELTINF